MSATIDLGSNFLSECEETNVTCLEKEEKRREELRAEEKKEEENRQPEQEAKVSSTGLVCTNDGFIKMV